MLNLLFYFAIQYFIIYVLQLSHYKELIDFKYTCRI